LHFIILKTQNRHEKTILLTIFTLPLIAFSQSQDYLGKWRNSDTTELVEITSDTIFYYEIVDSCYNLDKITYTDSVNNTIMLSVAGQSCPVSYTLQDSNSVLNLTSLFKCHLLFL